MAAANFPPNGTTDPVERVLGRLDKVRRSGDGYVARCPSHPDRQPSLSVRYGTDGQVLLHCFAGCKTERIISDLGLTWADLFPAGERRNGTVDSRLSRPVYMAGREDQQSEQAEKSLAREDGRTEYAIRDTEGTLVAIHERIDYDDGSKKFLWKRPNGEYGLDGRETETLPLYGSERLADLPDGAMVVIAEGEKATEALWNAGLNAVGTVTGADAAPSVDVLRCLERFDVVLWPDNDDAGRDHMRVLAERLLPLEARS